MPLKKANMALQTQLQVISQTGSQSGFVTLVLMVSVAILLSMLSFQHGKHLKLSA